MPPDIQSMLSAPFDDSDIEWRLQYANDEKGFGIAVPYITNRAIQNRLDKTVGVGGWKNEFIPWHGDGKKASQLCGISIYFADRNEWITKYDGAEDSDIESVKGGLSDSMKRAAVQWGIGRYLYTMDTVYVDIDKNGKTTVIAQKSQPKLSAAHQNVVQKLFGQKKSPAPAEQPALAAPPAEVLPLPQANPASSAPRADTGATSRCHKPKNVYCVLAAARQPSVRGVNTNLRLQDSAGKIISAFVQGENPALVEGAWLQNAVITQKEKEGIVFYTLDSFDLAVQNAA